jgi:hypothetical protein
MTRLPYPTLFLTILIDVWGGIKAIYLLILGACCLLSLEKYIGRFSDWIYTVTK